MPIEDEIRRSLERRVRSVESGPFDPRITAPRNVPTARRFAIAAFALLIGAASFAFLLRRGNEEPVATPTIDDRVHPVAHYSVMPGIGRMVVADGSVWVAATDRVYRIDPGTGEMVGSIDVPTVGPSSGLTAGEGLVWVTWRDGVAGIDPASNDVVAHDVLQTGVNQIGFFRGQFVFGHSAEGNGQILAYDPTSDRFGPSAGTGGGEVAAFVATELGVWVATQSWGPALTRVSFDQPTGDDGEVLPEGTKVLSLALAGGFVWAAGNDLLYRVDPNSAAITTTTPVDGLRQVAGDGTHLWTVTQADDSTSVQERDTRSGDAIGDDVTIPHSGTAAITAAQGQAWVSFRNDGTLSRIGSVNEPDESTVLGRGDVSVPDLTGLTFDEATTQLASFGLRQGILAFTRDGNATPLTVADQEARPGSGLAPGSAVALLVNPPTCLDPVPPDDPAYGARVEPASGPVGTMVSVTGPTLRQGDDEWYPSAGVEVWLDEPPLAERGADFHGDDVLLAAQDLQTECSFDVTFVVPELSIGRHSVVVVTRERFSGGYGERTSAPIAFTVSG